MKAITRNIALILGILVGTSAATAQAVAPGDAKPMAPVDVRNAALRQLGLSPAQMQQIRLLNMERKPHMDVAQQRLREATRHLDNAIYADNVGDAEFQVRLKDFQLAQAEVAKIKFTHELGVRRILTQDQLVRFLRMRQRFEEVRRNAETRNNAQKPAIL